MKRLFINSAAGLALLIITSSCGDTTGGKSTPIDETKENGVAPVQSVEGTPTTTIDTTMQAHTNQMKTANRAQRLDTSTMPPHASSGSGVSNTTDKTTTSGSANGSRK